MHSITQILFLILYSYIVYVVYKLKSRISYKVKKSYTLSRSFFKPHLLHSSSVVNSFCATVHVPLPLFWHSFPLVRCSYTKCLPVCLLLLTFAFSGCTPRFVCSGLHTYIGMSMYIHMSIYLVCVCAGARTSWSKWALRCSRRSAVRAEPAILLVCHTHTHK